MKVLALIIALVLSISPALAGHRHPPHSVVYPYFDPATHQLIAIVHCTGTFCYVTPPPAKHK